MKHVDEYRDTTTARDLIRQIESMATRRWVLMEVCGGQTHGLLRHGIPSALRDCIELIHGPGCPVCVTSEEKIDLAQQLSLQPGVLVTSFGDMLRVPGSAESMLAVRGRGGRIKTVYSPIDAVRLAELNPKTHVVFFAVGFETTTPATALAILQAKELALQNFSLLVSHVRVQPAMEAILKSPANRVQAFLAAGHVCAVTGFVGYAPFAQQFGVPVVVSGFEPVDLLAGILECVAQLESGRHDVVNCYSRAVGANGNSTALRVVESVYEVVDQHWRGMGMISNGGYRLRPEFREFDAAERFGQISADPVRGESVSSPAASACRAGEVLSGQLSPCNCSEFGKSCTPETPLGAPMVSSEGACAAWYRYGQSAEILKPEPA